MNFDKALGLLGLNANFTETELRKNYLDLAKIYHPDALVGKPIEEVKAAEEKMKEINWAYETLKNVKKSSYSNRQSGYTYKGTTNNDRVIFNYYRNSKADIIDSYKYSYIYNKYEFTPDVISDFVSFFNIYYFDIISANTKEKIDKLFSEFKQGVKEWYIKLKDIYFKKHNIPENTTFIINEDLSFYEFYNNLEKVKEQSQNSIIKEVNDIVDKYKLYAYYSDLEAKIEKMKQKTIKAISDILYIDSNYYLNKKNYYLNHFQNDIEILFKRVSKNKPLYLEMAHKVEEKDLSCKEELEALYNSMLDSLFPLCYEKFKSELDYHGYYGERMIIFQELIIKYNDVLKKSNDLEYQKLLIELYKKIVELFTKIYIPIESLRLLNEINFNNYDEAVRIYYKVKRNLITLKDVGVSICKDDINGICVKHIQINDEEYNISSYNDETCINESYVTLGNKIILYEFMEKAEEFFATFTWNDDDIVALYRFDSIILGIYKGRLEFFKDIKVTNVEVQNEKDFGIYQDREYVKSMIINEYYKEIELHKNQNNTVKK